MYVLSMLLLLSKAELSRNNDHMALEAENIDCLDLHRKSLEQEVSTQAAGWNPLGNF